MKIIEYPIPHEHGQEGFGFIYDRTTDTIHLTGGAFHWELMRAAQLSINTDTLFAGYVDQEDTGNPQIKFDARRDMSGMEVLTEAEIEQADELLKGYLYKDPSYLNKTSSSHIVQIFDAHSESEGIKALYFADEDVLYWWYPDDTDGFPTHVDALKSGGLKWDDLIAKHIIPIIGGEVSGEYSEPFVADGMGTPEQQARGTQLLNELLESLRTELRDGGWIAKVSAKVVEVATQHGFGGQGGNLRRPVIYIPEQNTMYVGDFDGSHAAVIAEIDKRFREDYPQGHGYIGDDRGEYYGYWEYYYDPTDNTAWVSPLTKPYPDEEDKEELIAALNPKAIRYSNIYDPIEQELDHHVFKNGEPRQAVVNFIKRLYGRALKQEYGIENPDLFIDLFITGSLTTFQYSETSDCDVSVFPNYQRFAESFGEDSSKTRKRLVALSIEHIDGTFLPGTTHPLQFFVVADGIERTDLYQPGLRSAWSIMDEMGVVPPEKERSHDVAADFPDAYARASSLADKMKDALDHDPESARELGKQVHMKRQLDQRAGLGDYSEGNITYKWLLHEGLFDRIKSELHEYIAKTSADVANVIWLDFQGSGHGYGLPFIYDQRRNTLYIGVDQTGHSDLGEHIEQQSYPNVYMGISGRFDTDGMRIYGDPPEELYELYQQEKPKIDKLLRHPKYPPGGDVFAKTAADVFPVNLVEELETGGYIFILHNDQLYLAPASGVHIELMKEIANPAIGDGVFAYGDGAGYGRPNSVHFYGYTDGITGEGPPELKQKVIHSLQEAGYLDREFGEHANPDSLQVMPEKRASTISNLVILPDSDVSHQDTARAGNGYPVVYDHETGNTYIGPLGSHHQDVMRYLIDHELLTDVGSWDNENYTFINIGPPDGFGGPNPGEYNIAYYGGDSIPGLDQELIDGAKQQNNPWNKTSAIDGDREIRWGYNGLTGEVITTKAGSDGDIITHMDMASKWLSEASGEAVDWEDLEREYENFFFGYADWNPETQKVENIQVYSLDMASPDYKLGPADFKIIEDTINAEAPEYMRNVR